MGAYMKEHEPVLPRGERADDTGEDCEPRFALRYPVSEGDGMPASRDGHRTGILGRLLLTGLFALAIAAALAFAVPAGAVDTVEADDDILGVAIGTSPRTGFVSSEDPGEDEWDVYAITVEKGKQLNATLNWTAGKQCFMYLYPPGTASVLGGVSVAQIPSVATGSGSLSYDALDGGTYYLAIQAFDSGIDYSLSWSFAIAGTKPTNMALITSSATPDYNRAVTLGIFLRSNGAAVPGKVVVIERWTGSRWAVVGYPTTAANGNATFSVKPALYSKTIYRARFPQSLPYLTCTSNMKTVTPRAHVSAPIAPPTLYRGVDKTVAGYLRPRHASGTKPVRIYRQKLFGTTWKWQGYVLATASDYSAYSKYSVKTQFPSAGRWRLRAYAPADSLHTASLASAWYYVTVLDVYVGTPVAPTTMYKDKAKTVYGSLKPRHTAGTYPIRIYRQRKVDGVWKSYGDPLKAKVSDYKTYSRYTKSIKFPYKGSWRIRAYHPAHGEHGAKWSGWDYVTVK